MTMKNTYQFALVGQTNSGKTCYLTTLAMQAIGHPGNMTVAWKRDMLGDDGAPSKDEPSKRSKAWGAVVRDAVAAQGGTPATASFDDERTARANGTDWIRKAIAAIERGELPKGNPPERCILDYEVGSTERGSTQISLVDYSGEAINADMKGPSRDGILRHFRKCDGLIVVAEAVPEDHPDREVVETRVRKVIDFFRGLHGKDEQRLVTAIAVMLTKWDAVSPVDFDDPASENADIETYLQQRPLYDNLVDAISHMVAQQHDVTPEDGSGVGLQRGNARVFASSSFGHSVQEPDGRHTPLLSDRRPFCLIDPLLWLADRADKIATAELAAASTGWTAWLPWNAWSTFQRARLATVRMPRKSPRRRQTAGFRNAALGRLVTAAALMLFVGDTLYYATVRRGVESRRTAIASGGGTPQEVAAARDFGLGVVGSPWIGLLPTLVPPLKPAGQLLAEEATANLEKTLGEAVAQARTGDSLTTQLKACEDYLRHLETGKRAGEVKAWKAELEDQVRLQDARTKLATLGDGITTLDEAALASRLSELVELVEQAVRWPEDLYAKAENLRTQLNEQQGQRIRNKARAELASAISDALESSNYVAAVDVVVNHPDKNDDWETIATALPPRILEACRRRTQELAARPNFAEAMLVGGSAKAAMRQADDLPARFPAPRAAFRKALPELEALLTETVDRPYDRYLYDQVRNRPTVARCEEYLSKAPLKSMDRMVRDYKDYLDEHSNPRTLQVTAHIKWGTLAWDGLTVGYQVKRRVTVNRQPKIADTLRMNNRTGREESFGRFELEVPSSDQPLDVAIVFTEDDWTGDDDDVGKWSGQLTPLEMQDAQRIEVDGGSLTKPHTIWFTVDRNRYPDPPPLPSWANRP